MTANTGVHTCSYYCERPECVRRQRDELRDRMEATLAQQPGARDVVDGCHCATCTCNPWMTPAVRFDTSPAAMEGAIRDHLIALGWTPPEAQQPAGRVHDLAARLVDELDGLVGESDGVSGLHLNGDVATWDELLPGGRFERLSSLDELRAALAAQQQGGRDHG